MHSHATCHDGTRYVYSLGGLTNKESPVSDCYRLDITNVSDNWSQVLLPIGGLYSHNLHLANDWLICVGGVSVSGEQLELQLVELSTLCINNIKLPVSLDNSLRMYFNHTSHILWDGIKEHLKLIIVGGGGNCFSFGTHINRLISVHDVDLM